MKHLEVSDWLSNLFELCQNRVNPSGAVNPLGNLENLFFGADGQRHQPNVSEIKVRDDGGQDRASKRGSQSSAALNREIKIWDQLATDEKNALWRYSFPSACNGAGLPPAGDAGNRCPTCGEAVRLVTDGRIGSHLRSPMTRETLADEMKLSPIKIWRIIDGARQKVAAALAARHERELFRMDATRTFTTQ